MVISILHNNTKCEVRTQPFFSEVMTFLSKHYEGLLSQLSTFWLCKASLWYGIWYFVAAAFTTNIIHASLCVKRVRLLQYTVNKTG